MSAKKTSADTSQTARELTVVNKLGIHARPAAMFVRLATQYKCDVLVEKDGETVNGKSIMGLMMLAAGPGSRIRVHATGVDAHQAAEALASLVNGKFNEE